MIIYIYTYMKLLASMYGRWLGGGGDNLLLLSS